ncbi:acyl-CoA carboxylase subunit epsilon [Glycomyces sp. NPDC049804]|uniref:acyl-CoA carboxylase subunit epsilon n=1 Tax=Glycomyces sp. NPDC049804 TaxID=3154363 RepID=UPI0034153C51
MSLELKVVGESVPLHRGNPTDEPVLRVLRGRPSPEELAALVGLITALPRPVEESEAPARKAAWSNPGLKLRVRRSWRDTAVPARRGMDR